MYYSIIVSTIIIYSNSHSPEQDIKWYPNGVRLDNREVFRAPGPRNKYFRQLFCSINNIIRTIYQELHQNTTKYKLTSSS